MHRSRVANRARFTSSYSILTTKLNKNSFCGISDRAKRAAVAPRAAKRTESARRVVSTVDVCAFSSAIRGAAINQPLFRKAGVMRYDPLKKNVVRPFRALFSFVFGVVRGIVQSALMLGMAPLQVFPIGKLLTNHKISVLKHLNSLPRTHPKLIKSVSTQSVPALSSHPLKCLEQKASEYPLQTAGRHRRVKSTMDGNSKEIADVLKAYNTSESRDRLISKLKDMKSGAAECIKNLSQRNLEQSSLTRRELLICKQEMVQLSKQLSGNTAERRPPSRDYRRSYSVMERPTVGVSQEGLSRTVTLDRAPMRPKSQPSQRMSMDSLTERVKEVTLRKGEAPSNMTRSESLRMKLKQHEHMVDTLKSKYAALSRSKDRERRMG